MAMIKSKSLEFLSFSQWQASALRGKLTAFVIHIKHRMKKINPANASSRRLDIMQSVTGEQDVDFSPILRHKIRDMEYRPVIQKDCGIPAAVESAMSTVRLVIR